MLLDFLKEIYESQSLKEFRHQDHEPQVTVARERMLE